ncbi:hypothetical protein Athai_40980 [Actinocatenispora thailandica]|uniref:Uncharacterized protein n=1 Tax=Actinocatenispora thailandica TaxID=227318 RepID=A0A7R7DRK6_9ACTN|nr:hypothetical protein [Actinocatenispora thailandica]BCJ36595.1 hypothetical protein Athai_40980 [Actinocatenispora thailandica]
MLPDLTALRRRLQLGPIDHRTAGAEMAVLHRAVTVPTPTARHRNNGGGVGVLTEADTLTSFDTMAAAARFAGTLHAATGIAAEIDTRTLGIRHRHEMHFVLVPPAEQDAVLGALAAGWHAARAAVAGPAGSTATGPATAAAIWRALLLTTAPVRNTADLRLRIRDTELLALAVRSAQVLGVPTQARATGTLGVLSVSATDGVYRLLDRLVPRLPAARRPVPGSRPTGMTRPARAGAAAGPRRPMPIH